MPDERVPVGVHVKIVKRGKKGMWTAEFSHEGQHRRRALKTGNKKVATTLAVALDKDLSEGTFQQAARNAQIAPAIEQYLSTVETNDRAESTITVYRRQLYSFRDFCSERGIARLKGITPLLFDAYRAAMKTKHHPDTLYRESITAKQFLKWSTSRGLLARNPLMGYRLHKPPRLLRPAPTLSQVWQILNHYQGERRQQLAVLAFSGMRAGDLRRLRIEDVDLQGDWFHIVSRRGAETKTRVSRKVPIHPLLRSLLADHQSSGPWFFTARPSRKYPEGGRPILIGKLNDHFVAEIRKLGLPAGRDLPGFTVHSLRRFFETHCVNAGIPQRVIDTWIGHRSDRSMAAVYYYLCDEESQNFMKKVSFETGKPSANDGETRNKT